MTIWVKRSDYYENPNTKKKKKWVEDAESVTVDMSGISMEKLNRISTSTRRKNVEIIHN